MKDVIGIITYSNGCGIGGRILNLELFGIHASLSRQIVTLRGEAMQYSLGRLFDSFTKAEAEALRKKVVDALDLIDTALQSKGSL